MQFSEERSGFDDFYYVVLERLLHFFEPVGNPSRYGDHVSFGEMMDFATTNVGSALLIRGSDFAADHRASRDESCFAREDIECIGFLIMYFHLPRTSARQYLNIEVWCCDESSALRNFVVIDERYSPCSGSRCDSNRRDQRCEHQPKLHNFHHKRPLPRHAEAIKELSNEKLDLFFGPPLCKSISSLKQPDQLGSIG